MTRRVEGEQKILFFHTGSQTFEAQTHGGFDLSPSWSDDSSTVAFASAMPGASGRDVYAKRWDGSARASLVYAAEESLWPVDQLKDGRIVVQARDGSLTSHDVMLLDVAGEPSLEPILDSEFTEFNVRSLALRRVARLHDERNGAGASIRAEALRPGRTSGGLATGR